MKTSLVLTAIAAMSFLPLHAVPSAAFHASFDQDFNAVSKTGYVAGKHSAEILYENLATYLKDGVNGTGALIGTGNEKREDYHIEYPNHDFITPEQGSVVFWVRPENWQGNDRNFHIFFRAEGTDADLLVYKVAWNSELYFLLGPKKKSGGKQVWTTISAPIGQWRPGEWHFVVATWGGGTMKLYIDGICKGQKKFIRPGSPFLKFGAGGLRPKQWKTPQNYSLIDELMLYHVMLTDADVLARYRAYKQSRIVTADESKVAPCNIMSGFNPAEGTMEFDFAVKEISPDGKFYRAETCIEDGNGKKIVSRILAPQSTEYHFAFPVDSLPPGDYTFKITVLKNDSRLNHTVSHPFAIPKRPEPWRSSRTGMAATAPLPWTAPAWDAAGGVFSCWNRQYVFGRSGLPEQIFSAGTPLLARPVLLMLDGKKLNPGPLRMVSSDEEKIELTGTAAADGFTVKTRICGEFDGFFWVDMELIPEKPTAAIRSLTLDFAFRKEQSTLFNAMIKQYSDYHPGHAGKFQAYSLDLFRELSRTMFVGNEKTGLEWFCEELSSWKVRKQADSLRLIPGKEENRMLLTLVDLPTAAGLKHRFRFGFQALPVKPLPADWRTARVLSKGKNGFYPYFPWSEVHNIPDPERKAPDFDKRWRKVSGYPAVHWYFAGFSNSPFTREWSFYGPLWSLTPPEVGTIGDIRSREWAFARNCPAAPGYIDWYVHSLRNTMEKLNIRHLYFDNQDAQFCDNFRHGCGWKGADGRHYRTFNLLATRELAKRIYRMVKAAHPESRIMRHMSTKTVTPVIGFADFIADGEMYCGTVGRDEHYRNIFAPEMFRAMFMTLPYGIPRYFIPQFQRAIKLHSPIRNRYENAWSKKHLDNHRAVLRHFKGYMLVHDALIWPAFGVSCDDWRKIQDEFGFDGSERFILYNDPESPFTAPDKVMVSCYVKAGKLLIIVMNDSRESAPLTIKVDPVKFKALKISGSKLADMERGNDISFDGSRILVNVQPQDYMILRSRQ